MKARTSSPWKILHTKAPPGLSTARAIASAASQRRSERAASTPRLPVVEGARSLSTASKRRPKNAAGSAAIARTSAVIALACGGSGTVTRVRSTPTTVPRAPTAFAA